MQVDGQQPMSQLGLCAELETCRGRGQLEQTGKKLQVEVWAAAC